MKAGSQKITEVILMSLKLNLNLHNRAAENKRKCAWQWHDEVNMSVNLLRVISTLRWTDVSINRGRSSFPLTEKPQLSALWLKTLLPASYKRKLENRTSPEAFIRCAERHGSSTHVANGRITRNVMWGKISWGWPQCNKHTSAALQRRHETRRK